MQLRYNLFLNKANWLYKRNIFLFPRLSGECVPSFEDPAERISNSDWVVDSFIMVTCSEIGFHIISLEPISERSTSKSFHEPSVLLVRISVVGTFWRAATRELYDKTWIVFKELKKFLLVNHCQTIYEPVRMGYSSVRLLQNKLSKSNWPYKYCWSILLFMTFYCRMC